MEGLGSPPAGFGRPGGGLADGVNPFLRRDAMDFSNLDCMVLGSFFMDGMRAISAHEIGFVVADGSTCSGLATGVTTVFTPAPLLVSVTTTAGAMEAVSDSVVCPEFPFEAFTDCV